MFGKRFIDCFDDEGVTPELAITTTHNVNDNSEDIEELNEIFNICITADIVHF